jgi:hypothetical protein
LQRLAGQFQLNRQRRQKKDYESLVSKALFRPELTRVEWLLLHNQKDTHRNSSIQVSSRSCQGNCFASENRPDTRENESASEASSACRLKMISGLFVSTSEAKFLSSFFSGSKSCAFLVQRCFFENGWTSGNSHANAADARLPESAAELEGG